MSLWEKTLINLNKGFDKLSLFGATFSERIKAEISIIRLRLRIDDVQDAIREEHRDIGRKLMELKDDNALPASFEAFFRNDEVAASLNRIAEQERALDNLFDDLEAEADLLKQAPKRRNKERTA